MHLPGVIVTEKAGETRYLLGDGLGSIRQAIDATGAVVAYHEYDPYGNPIVNRKSEIVNPYGFSGEWWESEVGLLHLRARWYSPGTGTFLSVDSVESEPPYAYVGGNVVNSVDPSGLLAICFQGAPGSGDPSPYTEIMQMCRKLHTEGAFKHGNEGKVVELNNRRSDIWVAKSKIKKAKEENENEPITVIGYSYGGAATLELAWYVAFDNNPGPVLPPKKIKRCGERFIIDNLITIDPVDFKRSAIRQIYTPHAIPDNVERALNLYAPLGTYYNELHTIPAKLGNGESGFYVHPRFGYGFYLDGIDYIKGATNKKIPGSDHHMIMNIDFYKTNGSRVNPITKTRIQNFLNGSNN